MLERQHLDPGRGPGCPASDESLLAVGASSASDAWAVGFTKTVGTAGRNPQAVHWNGSSWTIVPTPTLTGGAKSTLNGVVALSANNAWAVGSSDVFAHTLALRETG